MFKSGRDGLIHITDESRVKFRTNISSALLHSLQEIAEKNNTHVNYLIESGLRNLLETGEISFNKKLRPKDRVQYKSTYDKELLSLAREFAKEKDLFINDVIEYSTRFIDLQNVKRRSHRYRIE